MKAFNLKAFMRKALLKRQSRYFWTESPKIVIVQFWGWATRTRNLHPIFYGL